MGIMFMSDERWACLSEAEKDGAIKEEAEMLFHQCDFVNANLAVMWGGLIWFLPLCHDAYGENL